MPYIGKPQSADPITVNTSNIDDGTIQAVDISSSFREHISGSFQGGGSNKISGSSTSTGSFGRVKADGGVVVDDITIDGTEIDLSSGDLTVDVAGNIVLDADGAQIRFEDGGTEFGRISRVSSDLVIKSISNNNDILFKGVDGSSTITALQLDMSDAGTAIFNNDVTIAGTLTAQEFHTEFTSASILFSSGSTLFGDSSDDVHEFRGNLISGSATSTASLAMISLADKIEHIGDTNNTIEFGTDEIKLRTGGGSRLIARDSNVELYNDLVVAGAATFNEDSGDKDFRVESNGDATVAGDEPLLIAKNTQCPVVIDADRSRAVRFILNEFDVDVILSDDGLQHYKMYRDVEICVVDDNGMLINKNCLPAGPLREPLSRLKEVDLIVLNGINQNDISRSLLAKTYEMKVIPKSFVNLSTNEVKPFGGAPFNIGNRIQAVTAIANPNRFFETLENLPYPIEKIYYPDHYEFSPDDFISEKIDEHQPVVMTEKDASKCKDFDNNKIWYLKIDADVNNKFIDNLDKKLKSIS